jgi:hypothetical protein
VTSPVLVVLAAGEGRRFGGLKQLAPVGPHGEAVMDYTIHDALRIGIERVVVVLRPGIERAVRAHLDAVWGGRLPVVYAAQDVDPASGRVLGTAPAVLCARSLVGDSPFAVLNADDLYGPDVLRLLLGPLAADRDAHSVVAFPLVRTVWPGSRPVSRALCERRHDSTLAGLVEATVVVGTSGGFFASPMAGGPTREVSGAQLVSMNAWGFRPSLWPLLERAVAAPHPSGLGPAEALLPAVVARLLETIVVDVVAVDERCLSLTRGSDVGVLRREVQALIDGGVYPSRLRAVP